MIIRAAEPDDAGPAYLWVLAANARAIAFYRKHGFALDGGRRHDAHFGVDELRMVRTVGA